MCLLVLIHEPKDACLYHFPHRKTASHRLIVSIKAQLWRIVCQRSLGVAKTRFLMLYYIPPLSYSSGRSGEKEWSVVGRVGDLENSNIFAIPRRAHTLNIKAEACGRSHTNPKQILSWGGKAAGCIMLNIKLSTHSGEADTQPSCQSWAWQILACSTEAEEGVVGVMRGAHLIPLFFPTAPPHLSHLGDNSSIMYTHTPDNTVSECTKKPLFEFRSDSIGHCLEGMSVRIYSRSTSSVLLSTASFLHSNHGLQPPGPDGRQAIVHLEPQCTLLLRSLEQEQMGLQYLEATKQKW